MFMLSFQTKNKAVCQECNDGISSELRIRKQNNKMTRFKSLELNKLIAAAEDSWAFLAATVAL